MTGLIKENCTHKNGNDFISIKHRGQINSNFGLECFSYYQVAHVECNVFFKNSCYTCLEWADSQNSEAIESPKKQTQSFQKIIAGNTRLEKYYSTNTHCKFTTIIFNFSINV